jgi:type I restriction enzyme S subunit
MVFSRTPARWCSARLRDLMLVRREIVSPRKVGSAPYVGLEHVEKDTGKLLAFGDASSVRSAKAAFQAGDVLYGRLRPNLNKVWRANRDGICSTEFIVFGRLNELDPDFLAIRLRCDDFVAFASARVGGMQYPRTSVENVGEFEPLLPPLAEQRRIAHLVSELIHQVDRSVANARSAQSAIRHLELSILQDALDGELTRGWRRRAGSETRPASLATDRNQCDDQPARLPATWRRVPWEQIGWAQNGRAFPSQQYRLEGVKLLRPGNLAADGTVSWTAANTRYLAPSWADANKDFVVRGGELVMNLTAQSLADDFLGRVCLTSLDENCLLNQRIARLSSDSATPEYLYHVFRSPSFRHFVAESNTGSMIQHLSTTQLGRFVITPPPRGEQAAAVAALNAADKGIRTARAPVAAVIERAALLRRAIVDRAIWGDLATSDDDDENASELLKRIGEELRQASKKERGRQFMQKKKRADMCCLAPSSKRTCPPGSTGPPPSRNRQPIDLQSCVSMS